jgi:hypothetical protein
MAKIVLLYGKDPRVKKAQGIIMSGCGPIQGRIFVFCWPRAAAVWTH